MNLWGTGLGHLIHLDAHMVGIPSLGALSGIEPDRRRHLVDQPKVLARIVYNVACMPSTAGP